MNHYVDYGGDVGSHGPESYGDVASPARMSVVAPARENVVENHAAVDVYPEGRNHRTATACCHHFAGLDEENGNVHGLGVLAMPSDLEIWVWSPDYHYVTVYPPT
jgi:hypothetical protein